MPTIQLIVPCPASSHQTPHLLSQVLLEPSLLLRQPLFLLQVFHLLAGAYVGAMALVFFFAGKQRGSSDRARAAAGACGQQEVNNVVPLTGGVVIHAGPKAAAAASSTNNPQHDGAEPTPIYVVEAGSYTHTPVLRTEYKQRYHGTNHSEESRATNRSVNVTPNRYFL